MALALAMLGLGLAATPASALNHNTYNILRNADLHQYCVDIKTEDARLGARAQLWTCTHPVVGEQEFLLVSDSFGGDHIKILRSGYCLEGPPPGFISGVHQNPCDFSSAAQTWQLRDTGEIVNFNGRCLEPLQADTKASQIVVENCNGRISQRWFF